MFKGQYLNLSQLPIYGPVEYHEGNLVVVQIIGLEIDQVDERTQNLMKHLANLGAGTASGGLGSGGAGVLTDLAIAFLNGSNNDVIFSFTFTLAQTYVSNFVPQDHLTEGERVLVRMDTRDEDFDWTSVKLDRRTGRLMKRTPGDNTTGGKSKWEEYRDNTYLVVDVTRTAKGLSESQHQTFADFMEETRKYEPKSGEEIQKFGEWAQSLLRQHKARIILEPLVSEIGRGSPAERRAAVFSLLQDIQGDLRLAKAEDRRFENEDIAATLARLRSLVLAGDPNFDQGKLTAKSIERDENLNALAQQVSAAVEAGQAKPPS